MVVFVDLDDPDEAEQQHHHGRPFDMRDLMSVHTLSSYHNPENQEQEEEEAEEDDDEDREYPNLNALSAVLGNYPPPSKPLYRSPCTCATQTWLCTPCSTTLRTSDTSHTRAWTWRSRYNLDTLSGLSTGIGHGLEGVQCGRGPSCLSSRTVYTEIESDAASTPFSARTSAGYFLQEIEGIGGVVKKKVKRRMQVGDVVGEFGDERDGGRVLGREQDGRSRSWCSWCERVVLSRRDVDGLGKIDDRDELGRSLGTESDLSSSSSF
ncbi:hypothetical protein D6D23_07571 [Aureobasidium pullulans]|uniref:Uncharacterized protein n=1 Tax=Aureobasidium pullulans TaxID=5580 RepID=A0A4S8Z191_AURPU|nr:hypothetical protein D6D23_07571 [Aureobasidium pullulans]THW36610.1 hypothetical protein D6D22_07586 [Aureobasidium pullulans]THW61479.1 hypothetical protein D6D20_04995 [Aureobasidium pullulans]THX86997.1 hypothetical protein D6D04_01105 [Aureobasidium pullulans]THZ78864.1 hypothetical protein D6C85_00816 [Aureobasidium pullulans]